VAPASLGGGGGQRPGDDAGEAGRDVAGERRVEQHPFVGDRQAEDLPTEWGHGTSGHLEANAL
jgi:hypothetical protein